MESTINIKKISIGGSMRNIIPIDVYMKNYQAYPAVSTAIQCGDVALPVITQTAQEIGEVGIAPNPNGVISKLNMPRPEQTQYNISSSNPNYVDFSDVQNYHDIISKQKRVMELEGELLTNGDSVTVLKIGDNDTPAMKGLKEAINNKECDINSYENRFDGNFANDKRILNEESITLPKLVKYGNAMDMKMTLSIEDKSSDIPNPIGKTIVVELTGGDE